jgi:large subunit ribosomal protein L6
MSSDNISFSIILKKTVKKKILIFKNLKPTGGLFFSYTTFLLPSRLLINNKILRTCAFSKINYTELELIGLGYRLSIKRQVIRLNLGYSHIIFVQVPETVFVIKRKGRIILYSLFKLQLSNLIAKLLHFKKLNAYKLKGLKRRLDVFKLKPGKRTK